MLELPLDSANGRIPGTYRHQGLLLSEVLRANTAASGAGIMHLVGHDGAGLDDGNTLRTRQTAAEDQSPQLSQGQVVFPIGFYGNAA
ncbi:uncharacterized protein TrAFT101_009984 [Trichoderma asperellum]|uniref:uncharacterized protein n=1 Tax=Trichoderma asperellum TaxID=101201 RepID=UPI003332BBE8|nr:hypothetical protein TrAFT101_009984 [Trichoderma asperellum]